VLRIIAMKSTFTLSTKGWVAVILAACVLAAFAVSTGQFLVAIAAFSTAGIAAFDSPHTSVCAVTRRGFRMALSAYFWSARCSGRLRLFGISSCVFASREALCP
jgi:hypothetical protein